MKKNYVMIIFTIVLGISLGFGQEVLAGPKVKIGTVPMAYTLHFDFLARFAKEEGIGVEVIDFMVERVQRRLIDYVLVGVILALPLSCTRNSAMSRRGAFFGRMTKYLNAVQRVRKKCRCNGVVRTIRNSRRGLP